ncbi:MAG: protein-disulfide isomerase [Pseudomonadales bacterium]|nr:protein-disulfide isomerase [Pseudomonadales bacterium]
MFRVIMMVVAVVLTLPTMAIAATDQEVIKGTFSIRFPQVKITNIEKTGVSGIYQVETTSGELLYVSSDAKFIFTGDLLNIAGDATVNVSENYRSDKRVDALKALKDEDLVVYPAKEEKGEVLVFTDTSCGYCRKFHTEISQMNELGITVKYVAWPRYGLQSPAGQTMVNVWCSNDREAAMSKAKSNEPVSAPAGKVCEQNTIQDQINLGHQIGVRGTPAVFALDGRQLGGYMKAGQLAQQLGIE